MMATAKLTASPDPSSRRRDLWRVGWTPLLSSNSSELTRNRGVWLCPPECRSINPNTVQHDSQLARERDPCALQTAPLRHSSAQRFKLENRVVRVSITLAASYSAVRTDSSPVRVMLPLKSLSPDWYFLGTSPNSAPTDFDLTIRPGLSIADLNVTATSGPTPGILISRRQISSSRTIRSISRCNCSNS